MSESACKTEPMLSRRMEPHGGLMGSLEAVLDSLDSFPGFFTRMQSDR